MPQFNLIALTPPGLTDPSIAIAAARAGASGVLDLEHTTDVQAARAAIARLAEYARQSCGIKLDSRADQFIAHVTSDLPERVEVVILTTSAPHRLHQQVQALHRQGRTVLLEVTCLEEALLGDEVGADGLIAKGYEAGGWVGQETAFVLLQRLSAARQQGVIHPSLTIFVQGGIGLHTAAACYAAGAAGVVLDAQLALARESPLTERVRHSIARMDGSETLCLGDELGQLCRVYARRGLAPVEEMRQVAQALVDDPRPRDEILSAWHRAVGDRVGWGSPEQHLWLLGQDVAFAAPLAQRFHTVGGVLQGIRQAVDEHVRAARVLRPLDEAAPLANSHRTRYPIVQGPMARVSDTPAFAARVAAGGGLPFLALSMLRAPEVEILLEETQRLLGAAPWGVGILGFAPSEIRQEQLRVVRTYHPPFALIAGGRPDQAHALEGEGIPTYLHVPSPELLRIFLRDGVRRFVFEGREGGGHIGPRTSFVLWNGMIDVLLDELPNGETEACHVLFAGGIHDALSASMVAAMAAPLAERGVRMGVLLGTAYLFTAEAVASGAILPRFQEEAFQCKGTVVLESGPGRAIRCAETPFAEAFLQEKRRLLQEGGSAEEIRAALEEMELGRLRIACKGLARHPQYGQDPQAPKLVALNEEEQRAEGLYMIGQVAALRDRIVTIEELHREIAVQGSERLSELEEPRLAHVTVRHEEQPSDVAIIGMACLMPRAPDLQSYWENILTKVDAITEIPANRWDWRLTYDPDPKARDKVQSKWGAFLDDVPFDPTDYGIPPNTLPSIDPVQLLTLDVVRAALEDAGYSDRPFDREHTSVIFGASGGTGDLGQLYVVRAWLPRLFEHVPPDLLSCFPEWTEDSFAGSLLNVIAGRVANRFDLHGTNFSVDAACASSLAALYTAVKELETGSSDMVIAGGADTVQNPFVHLCFGKTRALSPQGRCRAFDESGDGTVIGEGIGVVVLKRLADAERDGDRIYAVIKAVGRASDGRAKGLSAPEPAGQVRALERAYSKAGFSPATMGLIEAHGTGTVAGDRAEVDSLTCVFGAATTQRQFCAIGSVKSMIGHLKATAAVAGLIKIALALHHRVLPPTLGVEKPNPTAGFPESAFYVNTELRPWISALSAHPRRAGVSAFGFGGTDFHAIVEEYTGEFLDSDHRAPLQHWPGELLLWVGSSRQELLAAIRSLEQALAQGATPSLRDLAYSTYCEAYPALCRATVSQSAPAGGEGRTERQLWLTIVATSLEDLQEKLARARESLGKPETEEIQDPKGIYFTEDPLARQGTVAFLFSGQGSQYPDMLRELPVIFPEVRETFERADRALASRFPQPLSRYIFPPPAFSEEERKAQAQALTQTNVTQPALGAADLAIFYLLEALGVQPDMVAGHSYGEYVALCTAGVFDEEALFAFSEARGRIISEATREMLGAMAAVRSGPEAITKVVDSIEGVWMSNLNAPNQTVISGTRPAVEETIARLKAQGVRSVTIPVSYASHSPLMAPAQGRLAEFLSTTQFASPRMDVYSNMLAAPYPRDPAAVPLLLAEHLLRPVEFVRQIGAMYDAGARIFVEVGPRNVVTGLTRRILEGRRHLAIPTDARGRSCLLQLHHLLGQLAAHGVPVMLDRLYEGRSVRRLNLSALVEETREEPLSPTTWLVNGSRSRPLYETAPLGAPRTGGASAEGETSLPLTSCSAPTEERPTVEQQPPEPVENNNPGATASSRSPAVPSSPSGTLKAGPPSSTPQQAVAPAQHHAPGDGAGQVMAQYQRLMRHFLDTQRSVMLTYLQGTAREAGQKAVGAFQASELPAMEAAPAAVSQTMVREPAPIPQLDLALPVEQTPPVPTSQPVVEQEATEQQQKTRSAMDDPQPIVDVPWSAPDEAQLTHQLLQIVSERTGYPPEMLDLDLDMEADLGIDSIKRVEILGAFQRTCLPSDGQLSQETMEQFTGVKTLGGIVRWIVDVSAVPDDTGQGAEEVDVDDKRSTHQAGASEAEGRVEVPRSILIAVEAPLSGSAPQSVQDRLFLITDDEQGIAQATGGELRRHGARVALVRMGDEPRETGHGLYTADLGNPQAVAALLEMVRQRQGLLAGIIHLLPLRPGIGIEEMDLATWRERLRQEVKSCFYLTKGASSDLKRAGASGGGWLFAATAMGGTFAVGSAASDGLGQPAAFFPGQGGLAGFLKTVALEWPDVQCRVIDFDLRESTAAVSHHLLREITLGGTQDSGRVEVGYQGSRRLILQPTLAPLGGREPAPWVMDSDWVVLVTGGARGIMAEVARELAERYQPTLILCGRSPLPEREESEETARLTSVQDLKGALIGQMRQAGEKVTPAQVEAATSRLLKDRDMRASLAAMRAAGARIHYYQVDVRDEVAFRQLIDDIYHVHRRLDGVIHGAGVIEDKLIVDKTSESFDRVFDTKADSVFILSRALRPDELRFLVLFASAAGRFGNRGQSDYAAGNEIVNKVAEYLNPRWPGRVVSINWGPWLKRGMVSLELQRQFVERGVQLIPLSTGRRILDRELRYGRREEVELVVAGGGEWSLAEASGETISPDSSAAQGQAFGHNEQRR